MTKTVFTLLILLLGCTWAGAQNQVGKKLEQLFVPSVDFSETPFGDAIDFLRMKSVELDPEKQGINIVLLEPELREKPVTLRLKNTPLGEVLRYTVLLAGGEMKPGVHAITISAPGPGSRSLRKHETAAIENKLKTLIIPSIEFADTPLHDALQFLVLKSNELDAKGNGINIVYQGDLELARSTKVSLRLSRIPLGEALRYTVQLGDHRMKSETYAIVVSPR